MHSLEEMVKEDDDAGVKDDDDAGDNTGVKDPQLKPRKTNRKMKIETIDLTMDD